MAGRAGIGDKVFVVAYGNMGGAERLWWLLRHFGHERCAVVDLDCWRGPFVEGAEGTAEVARDYWVRVTTASGTHAKRYPPAAYPWVNPEYHVVHSSIVACNANLLSALRGEGIAETSAEDNYKTLKLVFAAYDSARAGKAIQLR